MTMTKNSCIRQSPPPFRLLLLILVLVSFVITTTHSKEASQTCEIDANGQEVCDVVDADANANANANDDAVICVDAQPAMCQQLIKTQDPEYCLKHWQMAKDNCRKTCMLCDNREQERDDAVKVHNVYSLEPQLAEASYLEQTLAAIGKSDAYMYDEFYPTTKLPKQDCKNRNALCSFWAVVGECEANPSYMQLQCAPACRTCEKLSFEARCPKNESALVDAWKEPGDLDRMFYRIATDAEFQQYTPLVHSAPAERVMEFKNDTHTPMIGPWVIVLDNFLTPEECEAFIELGHVKGYEQSMDVGERLFDGTYAAAKSDSRTSSNAWCTEECYDNPMSRVVHERIEHLIEIPIDNYEYLQLLRYEKGQFYGQHHDYIPHQLQRATGVRILTVFLYLNDVEAGGGTNFPLLNNLVSRV
jgi:prolyl 4-hydroxylase